MNTQAHCPTCGAAVVVGGTGTTHYYVPVSDTEMVTVLQEILVETHKFLEHPIDRIIRIEIKASLALGIDPVEAIP